MPPQSALGTSASSSTWRTATSSSPSDASVNALHLSFEGELLPYDLIEPTNPRCRVFDESNAGLRLLAQPERLKLSQRAGSRSRDAPLPPRDRYRIRADCCGEPR